jgi:hypothetical protein
MPHSSAPRPRPLAYLPVIISALCAVLAAQMAWRDPRYLVPFFLIAALTFVPAALARWRMRRLLMSGDVKRVLGTWEGTIQRVMHPETMAPLMAATAYASYGWVEAARQALKRAVKGPAWDAALEQRLFVETLLDTFEGDREAAMQKAQTLEQMPMPVSGWFARKRVALLRRGLGALTRAFAHASLDSDGKLLARAADASPLVHWAMRYAAAIVAIDRGESRRAASLLQGAPEWPAESAFRLYHDELASKASPAAVA